MPRLSASQRNNLSNFPRACRCALVLVAALAACAAWSPGTTTTRAQSGRRSPQPISPVPTPTPEPTPQGESESVSRSKGDTSDTALLTLTVYESDDAMHYVTREAAELVLETFVQRLSASTSVSAARGGRISRKEAQKQAKSEKRTHVLVLQLAEDVDPGRESVGRADTRLLAIKLFLYEPVTGALKYTDTIWQRPYRQTTSVGGVRIPLPTRNPRIERFPSELQLEQAAREAADRVMMRFDITAPPQN